MTASVSCGARSGIFNLKFYMPLPEEITLFGEIRNQATQRLHVLYRSSRNCEKSPRTTGSFPGTETRDAEEALKSGVPYSNWWLVSMATQDCDKIQRGTRPEGHA
jgi:hypothetical protein